MALDPWLSPRVSTSSITSCLLAHYQKILLTFSNFHSRLSLLLSRLQCSYKACSIPVYSIHPLNIQQNNHSFSTSPPPPLPPSHHVYYNPAPYHPRSPMDLYFRIPSLQASLPRIRSHLSPTRAKGFSGSILASTEVLHLPRHVGLVAREQAQ